MVICATLLTAKKNYTLFQKLWPAQFHFRLF